MDKKKVTAKVRPQHLHDRNFKHNFNNKQVAKDFFKYKLSRKVLRKANLDSLAIESNEFIPSKYRGTRRADIVYSVRLKNGNKYTSCFT